MRPAHLGRRVVSCVSAGVSQGVAGGRRRKMNEGGAAECGGGQCGESFMSCFGHKHTRQPETRVNVGIVRRGAHIFAGVHTLPQ